MYHPILANSRFMLQLFLLKCIILKGETIMNDKKQLECYLHCCGTASVQDQVSLELQAKDRPIEEVLEEQDDQDKQE